MTHTPGPWRVREGTDHEFSIEETTVRDEVACAWSFPNEGEALANARLIAAAPTMFEALKLAERYVIGGGHQAVHTQDAINVIRAAITLATGRNQ